MRSSKRLCSLLISSALLSVGTLLAQVPLNTAVTVTKIEPTFVDSPKIGGGYSKKSSGRPSPWLEVEVTFDRAANPREPLFLEELTINYYVLLKNEAVNEDRKPTMLTGSVTHVHIPQEKGLHSAMFVSPRALQRFFGGKVPVNAQQAIVDAGVSISGKDGVLAIGSWKSQPRGDKGWWDNAELYTATPGFLLNKNETPFAPLEWDYFETIKPKAGNQ